MIDTLTLKANLIKFTVSGFARIPFTLAQRLGMGLGWVVSFFPSPMKKIIKTNIQKCFPEKALLEQQMLVRKTLMHIGSNAIEHGAWWVWPPEKFAPLVTAVYGEEQIKAIQREGRGVLILVPHLGAWEVLQRYMPKNYTCASMYRPLRLSALEDFVKKARTRDGADLLPLTRSGLRAAYERLANGQVMGVLPDQVPNKNGGTFAPFFGIPAWTTTFAIKMAQKTNARVFLGYTERLGCGKGFAIHFSPVNHDIYNADVTIAATAMNADIETCVRKIPEQYQWAYKRFKVQPPAQPNFY